MAKIVKTDQQEAALKVIKGNIKILTGINAVFNSKEEKSSITIIAGEKKVSLMVEKAIRDNLLKELRKKIVGQTIGLAKRNAISLDEEDIAVLENQDEACKDRENEESEENLCGLNSEVNYEITEDQTAEKEKKNGEENKKRIS